MGDLIRVVKSGNYSLISNYHLKDKRLSWCAKGLLSAMLALSGEYTIDELKGLSSSNGRYGTDGFAELERHGYLTCKKCGVDAGCSLLEYTIYEKPISTDPSLDPVVEIMDPEDMPGSLENIDEENIDEENIDEENIDEEEKKLRERLKVDKLKEIFSKYFVERIFYELCRRDEDFRKMMTDRAFEKVCATTSRQRIDYWERNREKERIPVFPVDVVANIAFDNIEKGFRKKIPKINREVVERDSRKE